MSTSPAASPSDAALTAHFRWRRASLCSASGCVEIAFDDHLIAVRDSKQAQSPVLVFDREEWRVFIAGAKAGEFDAPEAESERSGAPAGV